MRRTVIGAAGLALAAAMALAACKGAAVPADTGAPAVKAAVDAKAAAVAGAAAPTGTGKAVCDAAEFDYGTVAQGQDAKHTFVVKNLGDGVLRILNARGG